MYTGLLLGKRVEVLTSRDPSFAKMEGKVVDETRHLIVIMTSEHRVIKIPKSVVTISLDRGSKQERLTIGGLDLVGTPAERIKG